MSNAKRDGNTIPTLIGVSSADGVTPTLAYVDPVTHRVLVSPSAVAAVTEVDTGTGLTGGPITSTGTISLDTKLAPADSLTGNALKVLRVNAGETAVEYATPTTGTVTAVSVATANGLAGSSSGGATPQLTLSTTVNAPVLAGNGTAIVAATTTGTGSTIVLATSPTLVTPVLGVATATSINKVAITAPATSATLTIADGKTATHNATTTFAGTDGKTLTISNSGTLAGGDAFVLAIAAGKTLTVSNSITLAGTDSTTMTFPGTSASVARTDAAQTFTGTQTFAQVITTANAITASGNAATVPVTSRHNIVTNNSAATLTITLATSGAVNMQTCVVQILDSSAVAQTLTLVNTENSTVTPPASTNGSTTLPLTLGFMFNAATTKWRLIASA